MDMLGGVEGFTLDEAMAPMSEDLDIDCDTGDLDSKTSRPESAER
jgi:hypothetical protein